MVQKKKIPGYRKKNQDKFPVPNEYQMRQLEEKIYKRYDEEHQSEIDWAIVNSCNISMVVLRKLWGFGEKRMTEFFEEYCRQLNCLAEKYVTISDFAEIILTETNVNADWQELKSSLPNLAKTMRKVQSGEIEIYERKKS